MNKHFKYAVLLLLTAGLVGCQNTRWTTYNAKEEPTRLSRARITLDNGFRYELYRVMLTSETVSGTTKDGQASTVSLDKVRTIEVATGSNRDYSRYAFVWVPALAVVIAVVLFPGLYRSDCNRLFTCD